MKRQSHIVIVVEDEFLIRMMAVDALLEAGFEVIEVEHAEAALTVLDEKSEHIRALFTDVHMPGALDGLGLAHHTRANWPWISLLVASGKARLTPDDLPQGCRFLPKPYETGHLVTHIQELTAA